MNNTIFCMSYKKPFTNEKVSEVYTSNASIDTLKEIESKITEDSAPSSQKPKLFKQMLALKGCTMDSYSTECNINF